MPLLSSERVSIQIHEFQDFGSTDLPNPKDDKTNNDAMVNIYPLECPKRIIGFNQIQKIKESGKSDPKSA